MFKDFPWVWGYNVVYWVSVKSLCDFLFERIYKHLHPHTIGENPQTIKKIADGNKGMKSADHWIIHNIYILVPSLELYYIYVMWRLLNMYVLSYSAIICAFSFFLFFCFFSYSFVFLLIWRCGQVCSCMVYNGN